MKRALWHCAPAVLALALSACSSSPLRNTPPVAPPQTVSSASPAEQNQMPAEHVAPPPVTSTGSRKPGGYYLDDGPDANPPQINFAEIPDAVPELLPLASGANRPYEALGEVYFPDTSNLPFTEQGIATWYGKKFHGHRTASGERYDMYAMTAAHKTLPIPSYARITHVQTGKSIVVRINDRGPFVAGRVIDLSYSAAAKLGLLGKGSAEVLVERAFPPGTAPVLGPADPGTVALPTATIIQDPAGSTPSGEASNTAASVARAPAQAATSGLALQLGAFRDALNAQRLLERARHALPEHAAALQVVVADGFHRVRLGPLPDPVTQIAVAGLVSERLGLKPRLVAP